VVQVVEHLPIEHEAQNSNPSTTKKIWKDEVFKKIFKHFGRWIGNGQLKGGFLQD
jgi:hypothetical protein